MSKSESTQKFSLGVFVTAFLIGCVFIYFAAPYLPDSFAKRLRPEQTEIHAHDHEHEEGEEHIHDHNHEEAEHEHHDHEHEEGKEHIHDHKHEEAEHEHHNHKHEEGEEHIHDHKHEEAEHVHHDHEHEEGEEHNHDHEHEEAEHEHHDHEHEEGEEHNHEHTHDHEHEHDALALNTQALTNIGIELGEAGMIELAPTTFQKSFSFPGFVRYRPGRSLIDVPVPASGVITKIFAEEGEALCPGEPLFEIQLTREELTSCQLELLSLLQQHDLLLSEQDRLARLDSVASGFEPKAQREIELKMQENKAAMETQKQTLRFLGVDEATLNERLVQQRRLITSLTVRVPELDQDSTGIVLEPTESRHDHTKAHFKQIEHYQQLEKIFVEKGQTVSPGTSLCVVSDLRELWIEGKAFESDEALVNQAYSNRAEIRAIFPNASDSSVPEIVGDLSIRSVSNRLDSTSRTFSCFVDLKNYSLSSPEDLIDERDQDNADETAKAPLLNWRFKPGQRCELEIETDTLSNVFVVPVSSVAQDGPESFVFENTGEEDGKPIWHKRPVVTLYQTAREVVIANDGSVKIGAKIAKKGAYQLYVALTNGGGKLQSACSCGDHDH